MSETEVTTEVQFENNDNLDDFATDFFGQKPSEENPAVTTEGTEQDSDAQPSEDAEAQADNDQDEAELKEEIPDKPKKKTVQDRIDEVVRQREEIKRESAADLAKLRQEFEDFKKGTTQPVQVTADTPQEPTPDAVNADGDPIYSLGEFDPQYIRDLTRFTLNQERTKVQAEQAEAQRQSAAQQEQQTLQTQWNEKLDKATEEYPDLVEKGRDLLNGFDSLDQNYAGYLSTVIMSMDKGPDVLYYLANHPDEATTIVNSGAQKATLALGRIEARFLESEQTAPKPKVTKAPPPPTERARETNGAYVGVAPDTDDLSAFESTFFARKK